MKSYDKGILIVLGIMFFGFIFNAYKIFFQKDYFLITLVGCDPQIESCYENICVSKKRDFCYYTHPYYKIMKRKAYNIENCPYTNNSCMSFLCQDDESECFIQECKKEEGTCVKYD